MIEQYAWLFTAAVLFCASIIGPCIYVGAVYEEVWYDTISGWQDWAVMALIGLAGLVWLAVFWTAVWPHLHLGV
jgi:hypothetical protein